jgi:hypothetical protein
MLLAAFGWARRPRANPVSVEGVRGGGRRQLLRAQGGPRLPAWGAVSCFRRGGVVGAGAADAERAVVWPLGVSECLEVECWAVVIFFSLMKSGPSEYQNTSIFSE